MSKRKAQPSAEDASAESALTEPAAAAPVAAAEPARAPETKPAPAAPKRVLVAPGHGIGTRSRGIRAPGEEVIPADFSTDPAAGAARLEELVEAGYLVRA